MIIRYASFIAWPHKLNTAYCRIAENVIWLSMPQYNICCEIFSTKYQTEKKTLLGPWRKKRKILREKKTFMYSFHRGKMRTSTLSGKKFSRDLYNQAIKKRKLRIFKKIYWNVVRVSNDLKTAVHKILVQTK